MQIRRFEAASIEDAVRQVRAELGPDALVLSTRRVRRDRGMFGILSRTVVEVTAAVDPARPAAERDEPPGGDEKPPSPPAPLAAEAAPTLSGVERWVSWQAAERLLEPIRTDLRALRTAVDELGVRQAADQDRDDELERLLRALLARDPAEGAGGEGGVWTRCGLAPRHAREAEAATREIMGSETLPREAAEVVALRRLFEKGLSIPRADDAPSLTLVVGAPGVGKTTTLAKLAARAVQAGEEVALLSADSYRIGAEAQLRTYADLMNVPFESTVGAADMLEKAGRHRGRRLWIDTAGRGGRDTRALAELVDLRRRLGAEARVELVVEATTKEEDLRAQLRHYAALRPDRLIATKLDEAGSFASLANPLLDEATPGLAWLGTGQRVPEDLGIADPDELARQVLGRAA